MPLHAADALATPAAELDITVDRRWAMAYAAGVPDDRPELYDTAAGLVVHPLLPVAVEWQLIIAMRSDGTGLTPDEVRRGIHVGHDLVLDRPLRQDERLHVTARTVTVGRRRAGATQTMLFTATDADGHRVWRTLNTSLFLGVDLMGEPTEVRVDWPIDGAMAAAADAEPIASDTSVVGHHDAHVYTECARIWNPIHTDVVAARAAGLAAPILHGTATLARAVSITTRLADVPLAEVRRIAGTFKAPVDLGTIVHARVLERGHSHLRFDVVRADGAAAVTAGLVTW